MKQLCIKHKIFLFTECPDKTYGFECAPCSPNCKTPPCSKFSATGVCTDGCVIGYSGESCFECKIIFIHKSTFNKDNLPVMLCVLSPFYIT